MDTSPIFCISKHRGEVWEQPYIHCRRAEAFSALTPSPYGHSPYISLETQGERRLNLVTIVAGIF